MRVMERERVRAFERAVLALMVLLFVFGFALDAHAQTYDLTMDVLVNSNNTTGYDASSTSPGEYQRYLERYLEHLQIPYRVIDTATQEPPTNLGDEQLIVAGHTGLDLSPAWQQAILQAVQGGTGFVNFDADPAIGTSAHIQGVFGATGSIVGPSGTVIDIPSAVMRGGATPHYIAAMQIRFPDTPPGDITYSFHEDDNDVQHAATPTLLQGAQGTTIALIGNSPLIIATQTSGGRAVDFTTYDFMHPDRFGFMMGIDDLVWRSLIWAARKPFILRGYPRFFADQMDDEVVGWGQRLQDLWNTSLTGAVAANGTGGPWKVNASAQLVNLQPGGQDRQDAIADINSGYMKYCLHTNTGISEGDLYWNPQSPTPLTDAQWQTNMAFALQVLQGNGGSDQMPPLSKAMIPHFWNLSNNTGYDLWNAFGIRYLTEIQMPGAYYSYGPPKTPAMRLWSHPFRIYELPPTGVNPNEKYPIFSADFMTVDSRAGLPPETFFAFATQLLGNQFPSFDARWPNDDQGISVQESVDNWTEYAWRFWSGMAPVQIYNHDGGSFEVSTETERQQAITQVSSFLNANGAIHVFMDDMGAYMKARFTSALSTAEASPTSLTLNFTGNATDMDGNLVQTNFYIFYGDNEGIQETVPGFTGGYTFTTPNAAPPSISLSAPNVVFAALPGGAPVSQQETISNTGSGTLNYTVQSNASWLTATMGTGTAPDTLTVTANPGQLAAGVYTGTIQVISPAAINNPQAINITFNVQGPTLVVSPASVSFASLEGAANPATQHVTISNNGAGAMNWTATPSASWIQLSATSGTVVSSSPYALNINPNLADLAPGTYTGTVTINSNNALAGSPQIVNVTLTLTGILMQAAFTGQDLDGWAYSPQGGSAGWGLSKGVLSYNGTGATQLYAGNNTWSNYTVQAISKLGGLSDYPGGIRAYVNPSTGAAYALWLYPGEGVLKLWRTTAWSISTNPVLLGTSAHITLDTVNWHALSLSINAGHLAAAYDGVTQITVSDSTLTSGMVALDVSNQPIQFQSVQVTGNQNIQTQLTSSVPSLNFTVTSGTTSAAQKIQAGTSDSSIVAWSALNGSGWLNISPTTGSSPGTVSVQANASLLTTGTYNSQIALASFGTTNSPIAIPVTIKVTAPSSNQLFVSPSSLQFNAALGSVMPASQSLTLSSTNSGLGYTASSDSSWLTTTASGTTPGALTISVNQAGLSAGSYTGHITISAPTAMNPTTTVTVTLNVSNTPPVMLMQTTFPGTTLDGWVYSPQGLASNWSLSNNVLTYSGGGATQIYAGNSTWSNYTVQVNFLLSSLSDYPGGIRGYMNPATGAAYLAWLYPNEGVIKLWRTSTWNVNASPVLLGASARLPMDTVNWHTLGLSISGGKITTLYDGTAVVNASDSTLSGGMVALDVSNKPIKFANFQVTGSQATTTQLSSPQTGYTFSVPAGSVSASQALQISTSDSSVAAWSVLSASPWVSASASTGQTPGSATVQVNAATLAQGTYSGVLSLASFGATNTPIALPVSLTVTAPSTNQITVSPSSLTFSGVAGGSNSAAQSLNISSTTAGLSVTIASDSSWLTPPPSGVTPLSGQVSVSLAGLAAGTYTGHLTVSAPSAENPSTIATVTLTVSNPVLTATPASINLVGSTTTNAPAQTLQVGYTGGTTGWTGAYNSAWFSPSTTSSVAPSSLQVSALSSGMAAGSYADTFTLNPSGGSGTPLSIPVSLRVGPLLFSDNFNSNSQWTASPMGLASNWTIVNNTYSYSGGGATQQYAGSSSWTNYTLQADMILSTASNYPGGIRFRLNPSTGASYAVWLYPGTSQVRLLRATQWNMNSGITTLATVSKVLAKGTHHIRVDAQGSSITVFIDNVQVISATDTTYASGAIGLDVSNQPVAFANVSVVSF